ncbi:MAG: chemotaxis protein CheW, partial [Thermoguttaceae bacterium]
ENVDMDSLRQKQSAYLAGALGGPADQAHSDLGAIHAHLVEAGLNDSHFDAVASHLTTTLEELGVADELVSEVMAVVASTRDEVLGRSDEAAPEPVAVTAKTAAETAPGPASESSAPQDVAESSIAKQNIRVGVDLLESLMTTVSELVLARNQLLQMVRTHEDSEFKAPLQRLSHITTDLQEGVMKTRMQPVGNAWAKLPRIVRTLGHDLNKKIELEMLGADTELDRQVLELIKDPLIHMVRNSGDHGLESGEERVAAGKPETGKIRLNAYHEGGHIIIEISDDGRGIDVEKIKAKVLQNGLASEADLASMTDQQVYQFIFKPGFSTASVVTSVSGRGVGLDVVRSNIERIGGTVVLSSQVGKGSRFNIKIPLTLAIVSALIVEASGERFAIPQISVLELVRTKSDSEHKIEVIHGTPVFRLRDRLMPLVSLNRLLELADADAADEIGSEAFVVVTQVGSHTFGIIVDRVFDTEEIVVKPVSPILRNVSMFSGNTILGDGSVIMILDPNGISAATGQQHDREADADTTTERREAAAGERTALLVFRAGNANPKAVPLSLVARLEEIEIESIERSDGRPVVQYRGSLMPLVPVDASQSMAETGRQAVVVFTDRNHTMGLMVDEIVDIVEDSLDFEMSSAHSGFLGTAVIKGKATDLIDVGYYLNQGFGNWFGDGTEVEHSGARRLLLVDDSPFFRNLLAPILSSAGYQVTTAADADTALKMRDDGVGF